MWFALAWAAPPLELVGNEATVRAPVACEVIVEDHDTTPPFRFRLSLSAPDDAGRSSVQRVTMGMPTTQVPGPPPPHTVHEVDTTIRFYDERVPEPIWAFVRPSHIDWSTWPLVFTFVSARIDEPAQLGAYRVAVHDGTEKGAWGSCVVGTTGPGKVGGCTMLSDRVGSCLDDYAKRHGLGKYEEEPAGPATNE